MTTELYDGDVVLWPGDCRDVLRELPDASVDAIVTDPPYELGFMGKAWDRGGVAYDVAMWRECLRALKPGGHLLAFGGTRTYHRLAVAIEDAGFEVRDAITWLYGQGFPKSLDIAKAIDRRAGERTEPVGTERMTDHRNGSYGDGPGRGADVPVYATEAVTDAAKQWEGWGTALKPASEPIAVARKPFPGTVLDNVLERGTGALNIAGCRVQMSDADRAETEAKNRHADWGSAQRQNAVCGSEAQTRAEQGNYDGSIGRWPANVVLTHSPECAERCVAGCPVAELDAQSGTSSSRVGKPRGSAQPGDGWRMTATGSEYGDAGGASRFFPVFRWEAKAGSGERPRDGELLHPTVKPLDLMRWLVRLVTPPGGLVLDPFAGSGTTGEAALREGMRAWLVEREEPYRALIAARLAKPQQAALL